MLDTTTLTSTIPNAIDSNTKVKPVVTKTNVSANSNEIKNKSNRVKKDASNIKDTATSKVIATAPLIPPIAFTKDSSEQHYIAFATQKVSAAFVKEMQTAFSYLNNDEFTKEKLNVTYIQFNESSYIVWIGSFENSQLAKNYLNKIKPRLNKEIISFVPSKQYEIYLLSKSNILLIKDEADLKQYQQFMFKNIYKP